MNMEVSSTIFRRLQKKDFKPFVSISNEENELSRYSEYTMFFPRKYIVLGNMYITLQLFNKTKNLKICRMISSYQGFVFV